MLKSCRIQISTLSIICMRARVYVCVYVTFNRMRCKEKAAHRNSVEKVRDAEGRAEAGWESYAMSTSI